MNCLFNSCKELKSIKGISKWNTKNAKKMSKMFFRCEKLKSLDGLKSWKVSNVTDMSGMFHFCSSLSDLSPLQNWDTRNVKNMSLMFSKSKVSALSSISNWNTKNVNNMNSMFSQSDSLDFLNPFILPFNNTSLNIGYIVGAGIFGIYNLLSDTNCLSNLSGLEKWDTTNVEDMRGMFKNCSKIKSLFPISHWNIEKANIINIFYGCKSNLIIPPNVQKQGYEKIK